MSRKIFPGAVSVLRDRLLQGVEPVVLLLVAKLLEEADLQVPAIKLLVAIEQMHLQQRHRDGVHRRAPAHAGDSRAAAGGASVRLRPGALWPAPEGLLPREASRREEVRRARRPEAGDRAGR